MASLLLRVVLCAALATAVTCAPIKLASLPKNITVKVTGYEVGGQMIAAGPPCMEQTFGACQTVKAEEDAVMVSYSVPAFLQKPNATVSIVACFSAFSQYDRAWRKGNPLNLAAAKDCQNVAKKGLTAFSGNVTFHPNEKVPDSTMYMRAYLKCLQPDGSMQYCAYGNSQGFFQVQKVNDIPVGLEVAVGICCCISPIMLVIAYFIEKKKTH
ncbi:g11216 [Coccomyxa elongata]